MHYSGLFIGLTTIDIQYFVDEFPVSNKKIKTPPPNVLVGGPATNAAVAFAHLNQSTTLISACGKNSFLDFIQNDFQNTKISHIDLAANREENPVLASVITSSRKGERNIFTHNPIEFQSNIDQEIIFNEIKPEIILLDGFYPDFSLKCAALAKEKNIPVVLDCGSWKPQFKKLLEVVDMAICSEDFYPPNCHSMDEVIEYLHNKKLEQFAISRGHKSVLYYNQGDKGEIPVLEVPIVDTLGAGDFLHGSFCYYYLQSNSFKVALNQAIQFASFTCKFKGTRSWMKQN